MGANMLSPLGPAFLTLLGILATTNAAPQATQNPQSQWRNLTSVPLRRQEHSTIAINETTLAVVGGVLPIQDGTPQITGLHTTDLVHLYDIPSNTWRTGTPAPYRVNHPNVAAVNGRIYLLGGLVDAQDPPLPLPDWVASGETHVYDFATDSWTELEPIPRGMERGSAVVGVHGEMIYLAGGMTLLEVGYQDAVSTVVAFNTTSSEWQRLPEHAANIPDPRQHGTGTVVGDFLYVIGGRWFEKTNVRDTVFSLNLQDVSAGWTTAEAHMPTARGGISSGVVGNAIYTFGGEGNPDRPNGVFDQVEAFSFETQQWSQLSPMQVPRHGMSAVAVGNCVYLPGGGLQDDGTPVIVDGVERLLDTTDHFDSYCV